MFVGIEIGGTKLQLGMGRGDGVISALWRGTVNPSEGGDGIRRQIVEAVPELLAKAKIDCSALRGVGIGFGGPVDDSTRTVIRSHQIAGWENFPLADWVGELVGVPAVLGNDADVAGLAESLFGAGKGFSPVFYITVGTGVGGGLIIDGEIYRGVGKGAAEIGHLRVGRDGKSVLEDMASGRGIERTAVLDSPHRDDRASFLRRGERVTAKEVVAAAREGNRHAMWAIAAAVAPWQTAFAT